MAIKITKNRATSNETSASVDFLEGITASAKTKKKIKDDVGEFLIDVTLQQVSAARSPVKGETFKPLSETYKARKLKDGGSGKADMELSGDMLDAFDYVRTKDGVKYGVFGPDAEKADGHNKLSGKPSRNPKRRWIPKAGQSYSNQVRDGIDEIIHDHLVKEKLPERRDLESITSKSALNRFLKKQYPQLTLPQAKEAVFRDEDLVALFSELDLLDFF